MHDILVHMLFLMILPFLKINSFEDINVLDSSLLMFKQMMGNQDNTENKKQIAESFKNASYVYSALNNSSFVKDAEKLLSDNDLLIL